MAVEFKTEHTRSSEYLFLPSDIQIVSELNGRHDLPDVEWLIQDFLKRGQLQPVLIRNDGGKPVLTAGFSRWRAASAINLRKLAPVPFKLRCVYFKGNEQEGFLANIAENRFRNSTTELDDAHNIARLERFGMTLEQIAEVYRADVPWIKKRLVLVQLSPEAEKALRDGTLKAPAAAAIAKLASAQQREVVKRAREGGKVTAASVKKDFFPPEQQRPRKASLAEIRAILAAYVETGNVPEDVFLRLPELLKPEDALHKYFCAYLIDKIDGKAQEKVEESKV